MARKYHKIWRVDIGNLLDGADSWRTVRASYLIESSHRNGLRTIHKKAMALADEDGLVSHPYVLGSTWINAQEQPQEAT